MKPIKKILVPVDYTPTAASAFTYALLLASNLKADIHLINCVHPGMAAPEIPAMTADLTNRLLEISQESMTAFIDEGITKVAQQISFMPVITQQIELGSPVPFAKHLAKEEDFHLIVMGTSGAKSFWEKLLGTVSGDMLMNAPCPVLIVPAGAGFRPLNKLCFATDLESFDVFCGNQLINAFGPYKPDLHLVHVNQEKPEEHPFDFELVDLAYARQQIEVNVKIEERTGKDVPNTIIDTAHDCSADLIVMSRPHYNLVDQIFHRSVTKHVAQRSDVPLLILPQEEFEAQLD